MDDDIEQILADPNAEAWELRACAQKLLDTWHVGSWNAALTEAEKACDREIGKFWPHPSAANEAASHCKSAIGKLREENHDKA